MGMDAKSKSSPAPNSQSQAGKPSGGQQNRDPVQEKTENMEKKKGRKGKVNAGQKHNSHTCCGCGFPLLIAALQLLLGVSITVVAFIMTGISSSLLTRETPHWAGIIVCLVSLLGFILYCITYLPDENTSMQFIIKLAYFLLCALGLVVCILAVAFTCHHYTQINNYTCAMEDTCVCKLNPEDPIARSFVYMGVQDCSDITSSLKLYFLLQIILNLTLALVCLISCFVMWKDRYQVFYAGFQLGCPAEQQLKV
uniref:Sarcospan (Kras oncogene-associated gene) n=2 Tax=Erpetoichthys calabaricus TaxID=27687 RepID=A0A8C4RX35_ERPCA